MNPRERKAAIDAAEWQILTGWSTDVLLTLLRLGFATALLVGDGSLGLRTLVMAAGEVLVTGALTFGVYRRRLAAGVGLFALWMLGWGYSWVVSGRLLPPLGLIGILAGVGLFQGMRGLLALRDLTAESRAPAV
jgi:hypothetical protein